MFRRWFEIGCLLVVLGLLFTQHASAAPTIEVTSPDGGEYWKVGTGHDITWTSSELNSAGEIFILYWYNDAWEPIAGPLSIGTTFYSWTVPNTPTAASSIFVGNWVDGGYEAFDYSPFAIGDTIYVATGNCGGNSPCFHTIQDGIASASASVPSIIKISQENYNEDITLNLNQSILLQGGWDTTFTSIPSATNIGGSITIANGTMTLENIIITVGPPSKLVFGVQPTSTQAGSPMTPAVTVLVQDSSGNLVTSSTASITLAIGENPGSGTLSGTTTVAASGGIATFNDLSINSAGMGYTLTATSTGLAGATSTAFNIQ